MTCDLGKLVKNIEGRMRLSQEHADYNAQKAEEHRDRWEREYDNVRRYVVTLDVLKEIIESGELK